MNVRRNTLIASAVALALAGGGVFAQSSGGSGNAGGSNAGAQGHAGQAQNGGQGTAGANAGVNGANGGMNGTTEGCVNQATTASQRVAEENRPPGTPVQGAANKGSTDWSDQANCANGQERTNGGQSGAAQNPKDGGG